MADLSVEKVQEWLNDKKNQPLIIGVVVAAFLLVGLIIFLMNRGGGGGPAGPKVSSEQASQFKMKMKMKMQMKMGGPAAQGMANPAGSTVGAGAAAFGPPGAGAAGAASPVAVAATPVSTAPMLPYRKDPFVPLEGPPTRTKILQSLLPQVTNYNFPPPSKPLVLPWMPKKVQAEVLPPQPFRRMAGVMMDDRISAVLETNGTADIVVPGMEITRGNSRVRVVSISTDAIVLKTLDTKRPMTIRVGLAGAVSTNAAPAQTTGSQGADGGASPIYAVQ
jgi:hypothetical protein